SFTHASRSHRGFFQQADGGTLLLDEVTEMPVDTQVKLLRVLETGRFHRVGGERSVQVDVRIIAATNRQPEQAVAQGLLREDLYYRLAQFPMTVPPLQDRDDDVVLLAQYFAHSLGEGQAKPLTEEAIVALCRHRW